MAADSVGHGSCRVPAHGCSTEFLEHGVAVCHAQGGLNPLLKANATAACACNSVVSSRAGRCARAAEDDCLGGTSGERFDHLLVDFARRFADDSDAQLLVDDPVHSLALLGLRHQYRQAHGAQAILEEVLLHGECSAQQAHFERPASTAP